MAVRTAKAPNGHRHFPGTFAAASSVQTKCIDGTQFRGSGGAEDSSVAVDAGQFLKA